MTLFSVLHIVVMCIIVIYYYRFEASELFLDLLKNLIFALNLNKQTQTNIVWELIKFLVKNRKNIDKVWIIIMTLVQIEW